MKTFANHRQLLLNKHQPKLLVKAECTVNKPLMETKMQ